MDFHKSKQHLYQTFRSSIFIKIKELSVSISLCYAISNLTEITNYLLIIDIICNFKRNYQNFTSFLYFLSSVFYAEYFLNIINVKANCTLVTLESFSNDQINLMLNKFFKATIVENDCNSHKVAYTSIVLVSIIIIICLLFIDKQYVLIKHIQAVCVFLLYILFKSFYIPLMLLYNYQLIIQLSFRKNHSFSTFAFEILFAVIYNLLSLVFYNNFLYGYENNVIFYFLDSKRFKSEMILNFLSQIILILRHQSSQWVLLYVIWIFSFCYHLYVLIYDYSLTLHKTSKEKLNLCLVLFSCSTLITRLITLLLIPLIKNIIVLQILEIINSILLVIVLYDKINSSELIITLSNLQKYFLDNNNLFFYGIHQLLCRVDCFYKLKSENNKMIEKQKELLFNNMRKDVEHNFCKYKSDTDLLKHIDIDNRISALITIKTLNTHPENENIVLINTLLKLLNNFDNEIKDKTHLFGIKASKILKYKLILLYFVTDETIFRAEFFLKNYIYSQEYKTISPLTKAIFDSVNYRFCRLEKKHEEITTFHALFFLKLNNYYYSIIKSFNSILKNIKNNTPEVIRLIDINGNKIGKAFKRIAILTKESNQSIKIKEQPEHEKFLLIEELMFNLQFKKTVDYFDLNLLDSVIEKNNYFILLYESNDFIIKKAPLIYKELSGYKTTKLKNKYYSSIFPIQTREFIKINLLENIINKKTFSIDTVLESKDHYLIGISVVYTLLPFISGKLFIIATIECNSKIDESNYALINKNGKCKTFGLFFNHYFGLQSIINTFNLFKLFNIKNFDPSKETTSKILLTYKTLELNLTALYSKETIVNQNQYILNIVDQMSQNFIKTKTITLEIIVKNHFLLKKKYYFLIELNFIELKDAIYNQKKETQMSIQSPVFKQQLSNQTHSASSVLSYKMIQEKNYKTMYGQKDLVLIRKKVLDRTTFIYNICLIIIAIGISVFIQFFSTTFYNNFLRLISAREIGFQFYYGNFHLSNMIIFNDSNGSQNKLDDFYSNTIPEYTIKLSDYYQKDFLLMSDEFFAKYIYLTSNFSNPHLNDALTAFLQQNLSLLQNDGKMRNESYLTVFNIPKNYFHILTANQEYHIKVPLIQFDDIPSTLMYCNENQAYVLIMIYNTIISFSSIESVISLTKAMFTNELSSYISVIYVIFVIFFLCNIFSLCLLYLSVKISNNQILYIVKQLLTMRTKAKQFNALKIQTIKSIILNEMNPSYCVSILKSKISNLKKHTNNNATISTNEETKLENSTDHTNEDDNIPLLSNSYLKKAFYPSVYKISIITIALLASLYFLIAIISFPMINTYVDLIKSKQILVESSEDFFGLVISYYFSIKYFILLNETNTIFSEKILNNYSSFIYSNYTLLNTQLFSNESNHFVEYVNILNEENNCSKILRKDDFYSSLLNICKEEPILKSNIETMVGSFMEQLRFVFNDFLTGNRTRSNIVSSFHNIYFQKHSLTMMIYFIQFFDKLRLIYLLPFFKASISSLSSFLVIVFALLVFINILNYFLSSKLVIENLSDSLHNYGLLDKFFSNIIDFK